MNKRRFIVAAICLLVSLLMLAACQPGAETSGTPAPSPTPTGTVQQDIAMKAGDVYKIFFCETVTENQWVDGVTGIRADETRQRWLDFQKQYGVTVTWIASSYADTWITAVPAAAAAGEPVCDIFDLGGPCFIPLCINQGGVPAATYYVNLDDYSQYTNFDDNGYWNQSAIEAVGYYNGALHVVVPQDIGIGAASLSQVCFFNKDLLASGGHSAQEIYELYKNGEWTFEKFRQIAIDCSNIDRDVYGLTATRNYLSVYSLICANGGSVLTNNEQGIPEFTADSEQGLTAVNFFLKMCREDNIVLLDNGYWQEEAPFFKNGRAVFMLTYANRVNENEASGGALYQDENIKYGIVLPPKGPDAQDYRSDKNWYTPFAVFKGHDNTAGVVQCLSMYICPEYAVDSQEAKLLMEAEAGAYFDDEESIQTLFDAVEKNVTTSYMAYWDFGTNGVGWLTTLPMDSWIKGESTPEVDYAAGKDAVNQTIAQALGAR